MEVTVKFVLQYGTENVSYKSSQLSSFLPNEKTAVTVAKQFQNKNHKVG